MLIVLIIFVSSPRTCSDDKSLIMRSLRISSRRTAVGIGFFLLFLKFAAHTPRPRCTLTTYYYHRRCVPRADLGLPFRLTLFANFYVLPSAHNKCMHTTTPRCQYCNNIKKYIKPSNNNNDNNKNT